MRICIFSNYGGYLDEGMGNIAFALHRELEKRHTVLHVKLNIFSLLSPGFWIKIRLFHPEIIHYIPGPSILSLVILKLLKCYCRNVKTISTATQPNIVILPGFLMRLLIPDLVITQSLNSEKLFRSIGCNTISVPNGVDSNKFVPVTKEDKIALRKKYDFPQNMFIALHVGPIKKGRNVELLAALNQGQSVQIAIIGSITNAMDRKVYRNLISAGCIVMRQYFEHIEELYSLSDCYLFPTEHKKHCIEIPLSVLEAMSCNLPVISTKYGGLMKFFSESNGLYFVDEMHDFAFLLSNIKTEKIINTREKVLSFSWANIAKTLENIYIEITDHSQNE